MAGLIGGLGGPRGFGENILGRNDDGSTEFIDLSSIFEDGLDFFGTVYNGLYVNNNGSVTFENPRGQFTPDVITEESNNPEITPFFADVDTRSEHGSEEPADLTPTPGGNSTGSNLVYYDLDTANDRFVVTWDDVGYFSTHTDKLNAFQLILEDAGSGDFEIKFRYEDINWTTGDASDGNNGLGGVVARAGWTAGTGNPDEYFELPASGDESAILDLENAVGNRGTQGQWGWNVRNGNIVIDDTPEKPENAEVGISRGDPHIITFDGVAYDFQGAGEFVLAREVDGPMEIHARHVPWGNSDHVTVNSAVATTIDENRIMIDATDNTPVQINGNPVEIASDDSTNVGDGAIFRDGNTYTIVYPGEDGEVNDGDEQLVVKLRGDFMDLEVHLSDDRNGDFEGLLGNVDGDGSNDIALADGTPLDRPLQYKDLYGQFREDWLITDEADSLFNYDAGESPDLFYLENFPENFITLNDLDADTRAQAEQAAQDAGLEPGTVNFNNAVLDFALTGDDDFLDSAMETVVVDEEHLVDPIQGNNIVNLDEGSFNDQSDVITFDEFDLGTENPSIVLEDVPDIGDVVVSFGSIFNGQTTSGSDVVTIDDSDPTGPLTLAPNAPPVVTANDSSADSNPVLSGYPIFNGPISVHFSEPLAGVGLTGGYFDAIESTSIQAYDADGTPLGTVLNSKEGFEFFGLATEDGSANISGISFFISEEEPAGFEIDNLTIGAPSGIKPIFNITSTAVPLSEGNSGTTEFVFEITRSVNTSGEVTVDYTVSGTGENPADANDFVGNELPGGTVTFHDGQNAQTIIIPVSGDTTFEPNETFTVNLENPSTGAALGQSDAATGTIHNDDEESSGIPDRPANAKIGSSRGDPHFITFDNAAYDFQGVGEFVLARETDGPIEIQVRQAPWGNRDDVSINTAVATTLGGQNIMIDATDDVPVHQNGDPLQIADGESRSFGDGEIFYEGNTYTLVYPGEDGVVNDGDDRLIVQMRNDRMDLEVVLSDEHNGDFEGLLGNADGDRGNDIATADGTPLDRPLQFEDLYGQFRQDWLIDDEDDSLFYYEEGESPDTFYMEDFPDGITTIDDLDETSRAQAEQAAEDAGLIPGTVNFINAVLDFALTGDDSFITSGGDASVNAPEDNIVEPEEDSDDPITDIDQVWVPAADEDFLLGYDGNDVYILSDHVGDDALTTIVDSQGDNLIQLINDLNGTASIVANNELLLTLENGHQINIRGADEFIYELGGNETTGETGEFVDFETFVTDTLGVFVPDEGMVEGGEFAVEPPLPIVEIDGDTSGTDGEAEIFEYEVTSDNGQLISREAESVELSGFEPDQDILRFADNGDGSVDNINTLEISASQIFDKTDLFFDPDPDTGVEATLSLMGIQDETLSTIAMDFA